MQGWRLVLTGHSLGACCALLALKLRPRFPGLRCWAFGPPGGFCTRELAHAMRPWCTSVAVGKARARAAEGPSLTATTSTTSIGAGDAAMVHRRRPLARRGPGRRRPSSGATVCAGLAQRAFPGACPSERLGRPAVLAEVRGRTGCNSGAVAWPEGRHLHAHAAKKIKKTKR